MDILPICLAVHHFINLAIRQLQVVISRSEYTAPNSPSSVIDSQYEAVYRATIKTTIKSAHIHLRKKIPGD